MKGLAHQNEWPNANRSMFMSRYQARI